MTAGREFDLEERTTKFGIAVIKFCKKIRLDPINQPIVIQLVRSGTSIGANYREANGADSKKDFCAKISICKKEAKETMYWLEVLESMESNIIEDCRLLWKEAHELSLIFGAINRK